AIFTGLNRGYPSCLAHAWLALARRRQGAEEPAARAAETALRLSTRFDYEAALVRVADLDAGFRAWLGAREGAPAALQAAGAGTVPRSAPAQGTADLAVRL